MKEDEEIECDCSAIMAFTLGEAVIASATLAWDSLRGLAGRLLRYRP